MKSLQSRKARILKGRLSSVFAVVLLGVFLYTAPVFAGGKTDVIVITAEEIKRMNVQKIEAILDKYE